jgi:hypothetical protein
MIVGVSEFLTAVRVDGVVSGVDSKGDGAFFLLFICYR